MIRHAEDMAQEIRERMRGGDGQVIITRLLQPGEYQGKARLIARITLGPGCSIGYHEHVGEEEIFYIISGQGIFADSSDGQEHTVSAGDAAITLGSQSHAIRNDGSETLELLAVILNYA